MDQWVKIIPKTKTDNRLIVEQLKENRKLLVKIQQQLKKQEKIIMEIKLHKENKNTPYYPLSILDLINLRNIEPIESKP